MLLRQEQAKKEFWIRAIRWGDAARRVPVEKKKGDMAAGIAVLGSCQRLGIEREHWKRIEHRGEGQIDLEKPLRRSREKQILKEFLSQ